MSTTTYTYHKNVFFFPGVMAMSVVTLEQLVEVLSSLITSGKPWKSAASPSVVCIMVTSALSVRPDLYQWLNIDYSLKETRLA